jgi:hypothetical protein
MAARQGKQPASRRRPREEEAPPPAPPPRARGQQDRHPKRPKVFERSDSDEDQEDADEDEEEQEDAADESQAGPSRNAPTVLNVLVAIQRELKLARQTASTSHKVVLANLVALKERTSSAPSSAVGSPLVSFTSFQLV